MDKIRKGQRKAILDYYTNYKDCKQDYTKHVFRHIETNKLLEVYIKDASKIIGKNALRSIKEPNKYPVCNGYVYLH